MLAYLCTVPVPLLMDQFLLTTVNDNTRMQHTKHTSYNAFQIDVHVLYE